MPRLRHIAIVGGGLAGLAAAVAASAAGLQVDVHGADASTPPPPAHLDVVPNLLRDLVALGVGQACVQAGFPYQGMAMVDGDGRALFDIDLPRLTPPGWPASLGMPYGALLQVLREAAQAQGVRFHPGLAELAAGGTGGAAAAAGALTAGLAPAPPWPGPPADLTLVACGLAALPAGQVRQLPQQWCHALLPRPVGLDRSTWVVGHRGAKAQLVPVGLLQAGVAVMQPLGAPATPADLRALLHGQGRLLQGLSAHWHDGTPSTLRPVHSGLLAGAWHQAEQLRIGHSAHVLPPHFGQAAAQVVEDAVVLGDLLRQGLGRAQLLQAFTQRRQARAAQVHALVDQAAQWDLQPQPTTDLPALARRLAPLVALPA